MAHPLSVLLNDAQVAILTQRRLALGYCMATLVDRFARALARDGWRQGRAAAKRRLDRVLSPRIRLYTSEATLLALALALEWDYAELCEALGLTTRPATINSARPTQPARE